MKTLPESRSFSVPSFGNRAIARAARTHLQHKNDLTGDADCVTLCRVSCSSSRRVKAFHAPSKRAASARPCVLQNLPKMSHFIPWLEKRNEQHHRLWRMEYVCFGQRLLIAIANLPLDHRFLPASVKYRPVFTDSERDGQSRCTAFKNCL